MVKDDGFAGIDLAWSEGVGSKRPKESGAVMLDAQGHVLHADWTVGVTDTAEWVERHVPDNAHALLFVDAPLVVNNRVGQRVCETQVGQRYGRWKVSANSTNKATKHLAGVELRKQLAARGWGYSDGCAGPPRAGRHLSECYPYTAIVGVAELGYSEERPRYKRKPHGMPTGVFRSIRARASDELISRIDRLPASVPPVNLHSHSASRALVAEPSPLQDAEYKHREDLLDAVICAWTAMLWALLAGKRCQVLGCEDAEGDGLRATIIAPARAAQRRPASGVRSRG